MFIRGIEFTQQDFPGEPAIIVFLEGCTEECWYCFNPELWEQTNEMTSEELERMIQPYISFIGAILISGGEPMEQPDAVNQIIAIAKRFKLA